MHYIFGIRKRKLPSCAFVSFVVGLSILSAGCAGEPKHPRGNTAPGAEQHERLMWQSVQSKDWTNVERRLSPTFTGVTPDGRMLDRLGWVQQWQNLQIREFSLGEVQVHPEGSDMKVAYIFHVQ